MRRLIQRFRRDRRGVSAIEFAFIAPVMIFLYFGLAEFSGALIADRNVNLVASELDDLATQPTKVSASTDIPDMIAATSNIMAPLSTSSLSVRLIQVYADASGKTWVDWCAPAAACASYPTTDQGFPTASTASATAITMPTGLVGAGTCMMQATATYTYSSPLSAAAYSYFHTPWTFSQVFTLAPRQTTCVTLTS